MQDVKINVDDIKLYGLFKKKTINIISLTRDIPLPRKTKAFDKFKVFVPYAWGNMDEKAGLGGAFSDIIIGKPYEISTESFQEQGLYDNESHALYHAKYILTRFARACLYINKYSQHSTTAWGCSTNSKFH